MNVKAQRAGGSLEEHGTIVNGMRCSPGAAPSSMTCSFDVSTPFAKVFWAKLITVLAV